jgi:hypothetical protein
VDALFVPSDTPTPGARDTAAAGGVPGFMSRTAEAWRSAVARNTARSLVPNIEYGGLLLGNDEANMPTPWMVVA